MNINVNTQKYFDLETKRQKYAITKNIKKFRELYLNRLLEIKNLNSKKFWNKKLDKEQDILSRSPIYIDKINSLNNILGKHAGNLLDIGFGYGYLEKKIQKNKKLILHGIDISTKAVKDARKNLKGNYKVASILKIPFKASYFDIILALDVFEHILPSQTFKAYEEIRRVLKKNGILIISVPLNEYLEKMIENGQNPNAHVREYTQQILETELKVVGMNVVSKKLFYAFKENYSIKSFFSRILFFLSEPNLIIIVAKKK